MFKTLRRSAFLLVPAIVFIIVNSSAAQGRAPVGEKRPARPAREAKPAKSEFGEADPQIAAMLKEVSPARVQATIEKLASFGNRSTLSAQDDAAVASGKGIGAAREWIKSEFEKYSKNCGGCLEVKTDDFIEQPTRRIKTPTRLINVYAVLRGSDPA